MSLENELTALVDALREDSQRYTAAAQLQCDVFLGKPVATQPLLLSAQLDHSHRRYFDYQERNADPQKMLYEELKGALSAQAGRRESVPSVRANMGCGIVPSLFGLEQDVFPDKMPWLQSHLSKEQILEMKPSDLRINKEFALAIEHMDFMREQLHGSGVRIYPVDIQGPFNTAHLVYGDDIFYQLYDDPDFVHHLLDLSCHAIIMAQDACLARNPDSDWFVPHYNSLAIPRSLGGIKLSEDTSTLLNAEQLEEFVAPYIHRVLAYYGGGYIHYCGTNAHLYQLFLDEPLAYGLNFGNPEKHDMQKVLGDCAKHGRLYYGSFPREDGETWSSYYERTLRAAFGDDRFHIMMHHSAPAAECAEISDAWDAAVALVRAEG